MTAKNMMNMINDHNQGSIEELLALKPTRGRKSSGEKKGHPKAPKTTWLYHAEEMRPKLVKENPDMAGKEITALLSIKWKEEKQNKQEDQEIRKNGRGRQKVCK